MARRSKAPQQLSNKLARLKELEQIIEKDLDSWIRIGSALMEIRDQKLYKETHPTLEAWAKDRFSIARARAYQLMEAVKTRQFLSTEVDILPANEHQARPLTKLEPEEQVIAWRTAIEIAGGDEVTDKHVRAAIKEMNRKSRAQRLAADAMRERNAAAKGNGKVFDVGKFPVVLADPPWQYDEGTTDPTRVVENQYPTMSLDEICALPVEDELVMPDAVLFLWGTAALLPEALDVMDCWGFEYRTGAVWDKVKIGMGYWFRARHEHLLIGVRGNPPKPSPSAVCASIIGSPRGKHSEKPEAVHQMIEAYYPDLPKLELFARSDRPGWSVWGNEVSA